MIYKFMEINLAENSNFTFLGKGLGRSPLDQFKSLGLKNGDIIISQEKKDWSNEIRLKILWVGKNIIVYSKEWRSNYLPDRWIDAGEITNFDLSCREWFLENNNNNNI
jgi:hypothetical protein